jgi:hypothetical protein
MDCYDTKLNGSRGGTQGWPDRLREHAAIYREIAERAGDPIIKSELLDLASTCEEVADNIEDHLKG